MYGPTMVYQGFVPMMLYAGFFPVAQYTGPLPDTGPVPKFLQGGES